MNKLITISNKTNEFILKYNNIIDENLNIHQNIYKYIYNDIYNDIYDDTNKNEINNTFNNKFNKLLIYRMLSILKSYENNILIETIIYENIYKIILHYFKNDKSYLGKLINNLKPSKINNKY